MKASKPVTPALLLVLALTGCGAPRPPQPSGAWMPVNHVSAQVTVSVPTAVRAEQSPTTAGNGSVTAAKRLDAQSSAQPAAVPRGDAPVGESAKPVPGQVRHRLQGVFYSPAPTPVANNKLQGVMHEVPME